MSFQPIHASNLRNSESNQSQPVVKQDSIWGKDGFTFGDVMDMVNPLHHIPIISKYYQENTNDEICEGSKFIGDILLGGLLGGITGVISSLANTAVRQQTNQDVMEHIIAIADAPTGLQMSDTRSQLNDYTNRNIQKNRPLEMTETNPFFAHLFDSDSQMPYQKYSNNDSTFRGKEWGKV